MEEQQKIKEQVLQELVKQEGNDRCADCGQPDPEWASYKLGVFVCMNCCGIHRNLPSPVKSIKLDFWDVRQLELMKSKGNVIAQAEYEADVPPYYYRPKLNDPSFLREQWIRAKYERREFTGEMRYPPLPYSTGLYEGKLLKKGKNKPQFLSRKFVLSEKEFTLLYYNKDNEIVTWFNAIRAARYAYLKTVYQTGSIEELIPKITNNYLKEGYMEKTGPKNTEMFKKRWFTLDSLNRKLFYFKTPLDAVELGLIFIGTESNGYSVKEHVVKNAVGNKWRCCFALEMPDRRFVFMCEFKKEQKEWMDAIRKVLSRPMAPQDYTVETAVNCKR
ncbi:arf-GAP with dual PH domain-containing protein 1 isoform X2 [Gouania willdenowi]|uniref:arf-GAP with dual PH domain-containing protein 1 isoform X2 n=1 Tax=Gouania willdenowi TaxID=441366 RepID=UPI001055274D|nr:arf-GAP with dual PH domain-containing protein 1-like isoform X2 [Gouania willdenowi]